LRLWIALTVGVNATSLGYELAAFFSPRHLPTQEVADQRNDFIGLVIQCEVAGVDKMKFHLGQVALVRMRSIGWKNLVVLAPDNQRRRLAIAEVGLNLRIQRQIGPVVVEQIHLDVGIARAIKQGLIVNPVVGRDATQVRDAVGVLKLGRLRSNEHVQRLAMRV
jgi:hypothetical protein